MGTILIDKLLSAQVKQGASDLHITGLNATTPERVFPIY